MSAPKFSQIYISSSPHFTSGDTTRGIMLAVLVALLPECVYGVITFGIRARYPRRFGGKRGLF